MITHILKICWKQGRINAWIFAELLLAFCFLWFSFDSFMVDIYTYFRPHGFDIEHTYRLEPQLFNQYAAHYVPENQISTTIGEDIAQLKRQVEANPAVESCCFSFYSCPYSYGNSWTGLEIDSLHRGRNNYHLRRVSPDFFKVFRIKDPSGNLIPSDNFNGHSIVICSETEHDFFPDQTGVGKELKGRGDSPSKIVGVCQPIRDNDFESYQASYFEPIDPANPTEGTQSFNMLSIEMCIRLHEQYDNKDFVDGFVKDMGERLIVNNLYISNMVPVASMRDWRFDALMNERKTKASLIGFLLLNVFFGIIGTFLLRTQQRIPEIGLRKALGASVVSLRKFVVVEGLCLLTAAALLSIPIFLNLLWADKVETVRLAFGPMRFIVGFAFTYLVLAGMILLGVWYPTWKANKVQAAEALHNE